MTHDTVQSTRRPAALAAFLWSLTAVPLGLWQLAASGGGPFTHPNERAGIVFPDAFPGALAPSLLIAAGLGGLLLARARPRLWPATAAYAAVFALLVPTMMLLAMAGYLAAFFMPAVLAVGSVLVARGAAMKLVAAALVAAVVAALVVQGTLAPSTLADLLGDLSGGLLDMGVYPLAEVWSAAGGLAWAGVTADLLRRRRAERPAPGWLAPERAERWGKAAAYLAFACSLPYGLSRMSWLTPWPYLVSADELAANPGLRLWGLLLGFSCLAGGVLCLGLAQRWGERWPYWVPRLRGRAVPPKVAIVPAVIVAYLFTLAGISIPSTGLWGAHPELIAVFPFLIWGPALGAAALAYAIRRRATA
ncbi:hypothetical protein [Glycomyces arizonensis]|uniref:hypothetical protein n=1 Tax=Glycomyces arizonensis TaxID=256035 RepID=UPI000409E93C|nr:hypothetical protein [Glycomyces arizonensis]